MTRDIVICEVGLRDGLQSIRQVLPTTVKLAWIESQHRAGCPEIEVGSFVSPTLLPQLADTADLVAHANRLKPLTVAVLAPNLTGFQRALAAGAQRINIPFSVSETHSRKNVRKSHQEMLDEVRRCVEQLNALDEERRPRLRVTLATAFGCTLEGPVPEDRVLRLAEKLVRLGVDDLCLADTTGYGNPAQVRRLAQGVWAACGQDRLSSVHLHNTRGQGLANALMAIETGITELDASLGGIGGCPFAPGASGNIVTEDLVWMLESMGLNTGIDIGRLLTVREQVQQALVDEPLHGFLAGAGLPRSG